MIGTVFSSIGWHFCKPDHGGPDLHGLDVRGTRRDDDISLSDPADRIRLLRGDDTLVAESHVGTVSAGSGDDDITLLGGADKVTLGRGDDSVFLGEAGGVINGGKGYDTASLGRDIGDFDILVRDKSVVLIDRISGEKTRLKNFEQIEFADASFDIETMRETYSPSNPMPTIHVANGTQALTINDPDPSISVVWDRIVQLAVIGEDGPNGPTIAGRAYAMMHTAMYDAFASYDRKAVRVSFDLEGDNLSYSDLKCAGKADIEKAMSYAAYTVLNSLYPDQKALFDTVMAERLGYALEDDGSIAAMVGIDAAQDIMALRLDDGSNQSGGYAGTFTPTNSGPSDTKDISAWTPEYVPIDPDDGSAGQSLQEFLTPQWGGVEGFALAEHADGTTDHGATAMPAPKPFFTDAFAGSTLDFDAATITLSTDLTLDGANYVAGETVAVSKALIGVVINQGFIDQALEVVSYSANLTDKEKIIAEFWEDGGGTAFPPGTFMAFAQAVSARDDNSLAEDAKLFLAMSNAMLDAGIATWNSKVETDYARPVRLIRDLGELGLIGEWGTDYKGNEGYVIQAWAGIDPETGAGLGTRDILATDFVTFQQPGGHPSPPFAEYTSGHSAFSSAGAEILALFTGSDEFGGSVTFLPGSTKFEPGVPYDAVTLEWATFTEAAEEAGISRLYGGIHFSDGNLHGQTLGREVADDVYAMVEKFADGTATDADRPFYVDDFLF